MFQENDRLKRFSSWCPIAAAAIFLYMTSNTLYATIRSVKLETSDLHLRGHLGASIGFSGNTIVTGAYGYKKQTGAAYVFTRDENMEWSQTAILSGSDCQKHDRFGYAVDIDKDTIVVGAYRKNYSLGTAYVFRRNHNGENAWGELMKLKPEGSGVESQFSFSVAIDGNTILAGATHDEFQKLKYAGATYVFRFNEKLDYWIQTDRLGSLDPTENNAFGYAVDVSGNRAVVGKWLDDEMGHEAGAAYAFSHEAGTMDPWKQDKKLLDREGERGDELGHSVAIDGETIVCGSWRDKTVQNKSGSAVVYQLSADEKQEWNQIAKLVPADEGERDAIGSSVDIEGDIVVVGAPFDDDRGQDSGSVYVFMRNHGGKDAWGQIAKLTAKDGKEDDQFGSSVAIQGKYVAIGAPNHDGLKWDGGAVYVFELAFLDDKEEPATQPNK